MAVVARRFEWPAGVAVPKRRMHGVARAAVGTSAGRAISYNRARPQRHAAIVLTCTA